MGLFADLYNSVVDVYDVEKASGSLQYIKSVNRGLADRMIKGSTPSLTIWPAFSPDEAWVAVPNRRQGIFVVVVGIAQEPGNRDRPFGVTGDSAQRGLLVTAADVMNVADNKRDTFLAASTTLTDMEVVSNDPVPIGERFWVQEIMIRFKYRPVAGLR